MNYYSTLGLYINASSNEILRSYKNRVMNFGVIYSPSKKDSQEFEYVFEAFYFLIEAERRKKYDVFYHSQLLGSSAFRVWRMGEWNKRKKSKEKRPYIDVVLDILSSIFS